MPSSRPLRSFAAALASAALVLAACGSDGDDDTAVPDETSGTVADAQDPDDGDTSDDTPDDETDESEAPSGADHPIVSFAAHGPGAPNTSGPACAMGIDNTSLNLFRVTAPAGWERRGSTGGSGDSDIDYEVGDASVIVTMAENEDQADFIDVTLGDEVGEADLDGTTVPIVEAAMDDTTGYAIADVVYVTGLPQQFGFESAMTIVVAWSDPSAVSLEDATSVLSSIRAERCAVIADTIVAMTAADVLAVPEFENDPLDKTYPGGDQPPFDMVNAVDVWSVDQLAYLLPFSEPVDHCVAESLKSDLPADFPLGISAVSAVGVQQDALTAIADAC
ncbi:hypothetical protein [Actinospongicola halichondriae]|uniref:hypothetical protein n=1 Tax=Actinospongicola halichondriae TaxID=3236844 RepID=UPI003D5808E8